MWEPFLWLALIVAAWRWLTRRHASSRPAGPLPNVGEAPRNAEPIIQPRLDDNGLATYSMVVPTTPDTRGIDPPVKPGPPPVVPQRKVTH